MELRPCSRTGALGPMDRFLKEAPSENPAVFVRPDTGKVSTSKGCICTSMSEEDVVALTRAAIMELDGFPDQCNEPFAKRVFSELGY